MAFEAMISKFPHLKVKEVSKMPKGLGGLYVEGTIILDRHRSLYEKHCILAEEIGHHLTSHGDITNLKDFKNLKQELAARRWAYEEVVSLDKIIDCYIKGYTTVEDICCHLEVTPEFLKVSLEHYSSRYGLYIEYKDYRIFFDPLDVQATK